MTASPDIQAEMIREAERQRDLLLRDTREINESIDIMKERRAQCGKRLHALNAWIENAKASS